MNKSEDTLSRFSNMPLSELKEVKEYGEFLIKSFGAFAHCMKYALSKAEEIDKELRERASKKYEKIIDSSNAKSKEDRRFWNLIYKEIALMECLEALNEILNRQDLVNEAIEKMTEE